MTKQPPYATTLRLSKICRWFAAIALVKVCLLLALVVGFPLPELSLDFGSRANPPSAIVSAVQPVQPADAHTVPIQHGEPQGAAAAKAAAHTRPSAVRGQVLLSDNGFISPPMPIATNATSALAPSPLPTGAMTHPVDGFAAHTPKNDSAWWGNILHLTRLPVPRLGVDQAARAATLDTPPPPDFAPRNAQSPFVPPAQGIPPGQNPDGSPIAPRATTAQPLPAGHAGPQLNTAQPQDFQPASPPAPHISAPVLAEDPARQQQELARREQEVLVLKQQMEQRLQELQSTEQRVQDMLKEARQLEEKKTSSLVSMYVNMKPKQAAKALEALDERVAVKILSSMSSKQSGDILTYTDPKKVAKFTELISRMRIEQ